MKMEKHLEFLSVLCSLVLTDEQNHTVHLWALPRSPLSFVSHSIVPSYQHQRACSHKGHRRGTLKQQQQLPLLSDLVHIKKGITLEITVFPFAYLCYTCVYVRIGVKLFYMLHSLHKIYL